MIYPSSFEAKIGFDQIRSLLREECISNMGKELEEELECCFDFNRLSVLLEQTKEFQSVLLYEDSFQAQDFYDLRQSLSPLKIEGTFIDIEDLAQLRGFVYAIMQTVVYFRIRHEEGKFAQLWVLCEDIYLEKTLYEAINKIIDSKGNLRDDASEELRRIRREIIKISGSADKKIGKLLAAAKQEGIVKEDAEMTIRNGRLCIPVTAAYKRRLKGFVHDESATGQTVFIEPAEVFDANNEIRDLLNAEKREIIRILTEITNTIRPSIPNLLLGHSFLGTIDFIRAKAKLAIKINGVVPHVENSPIINWQKAIHPILYLNFKEHKKTVIPLDIQLTATSRILIISGPNAGGKSVCLKTVGLLQYMMQCGLAVPMKETSEMGIFTDFFIDIGDEQSIDNDLSTYSSHLLNLKTMVENLNGNSLFLIDEFGSGTEPSLGAAMAESVLERFYELDAFGIITTHFGNLKTFSDLHPEAINGAMLFDMEALKPLFMLRIGKPGSSFTYEIARQIGFPEDIVQQAIQKSGTAQIDYEKKLEEIELEKIETDKLLKQVNSAEEQLTTFITEYANKHHELETERKEILHAAKEQANTIIESANKLIEKTIREIKEAKADAEKTKAARLLLQQKKEEIGKVTMVPIKKPLPKPTVAPQKTKTENMNKETLDDKIKVGDTVLITNSQTVGEVIELNGNNISVAFKSIVFRTTLKSVEKISHKEARGVKRNSGGKIDNQLFSEAINKKIGQFNQTLDIRGQYAEEAMTLLENYLDEAILLGIKNVSVLHGKGNGILRKVVRQYLSSRKEVKSFADEALELGGAGITIVQIS